MVARWLFSGYPADDAPSRVGMILGWVFLLLGCVSIVGAAIPLAFPAGGLATVFLWVGFAFVFIVTLPGIAFCIAPRFLGGMLGLGLRNRLRNLRGGALWRLIELYTAWLGLWTTLICWMFSAMQSLPSRDATKGWVAIGTCVVVAIILPLVVNLWAWHARRNVNP